VVAKGEQQQQAWGAWFFDSCIIPGDSGCELRHVTADQLVVAAAACDRDSIGSSSSSSSSSSSLGFTHMWLHAI
jgi:hypothetical protein